MALGFGYLPLSCRFDPSYQDQVSLSSRLVPSQTEIDSARPLAICAEKPGFQAVGEEGEGGTISTLLAELENITLGNLDFEENSKSTFKTHKLTLGIATGTSVHDFDVCVSSTLRTALLEGKGSEASILPALAQGAAEGTNFCMGLYAQGIPKEHCVVPVIAYNGLSMCFGATMLLDDTFPTFVPLSKTLDLMDEYDS